MAKTFKTNQSLINAGFNQKAGQTLSLSGNTLIGSTATLKYYTDQSSTYTARSVVDAAYVTGKTSGIINIGSNCQVIYRGTNGITGATNFTYNLTGVTVPNLRISTCPITDLPPIDWLLSWDAATCEVKKVCYSSAVGLSFAANGLTAAGGTVCLGGSLCINTTISGGTNSFCINNENSNIVIDNRCNGGIYLKSQCGTSSSYFDDFTNAVGFQINKCSGGFKIFDCRAGANQRGIEYDGNYSTFYTARSLVDKEYVDTLANGLHPKQAVQVTTVTGVTLSGTSQTIDGISVANVILGGNRILVKNQTNAKTNGVYSASTGTWGRTSDFDTSAEVVQGSYFFVMSGTNKSTTWVLTTPDIITVGVDPLIFTLFSQITDILAGTGITITVDNSGQHTVSVNGVSLAGNSLLWNNSTCKFDVNISGGTLSTALSQTLTGATNGLTKQGQQVKLGGTLTGITTINGAQTLRFNTTNLSLTGSTAFNLTFSGGTITNTSNYGGLRYANNYCSFYVSRSLVDKEYVDKKVSGNTIVNVCNVSITYTATTSNNFIGVSGASCVFLMNNPSCGQKVSIADICGCALSNPITINGSGKRINDCVSCTSLINTNYGSITFIYNGYFWSAVAFTN